MHIGIIMDGNGRWAVNKGLPRALGHKKGASKVSEIVKACPDLKIKTLTLYAFSTENWKRAAHEVESLMRLFRGYLQNKFIEIIESNIRVRFLGDPTPLPKDIYKQMKNLEDQSSGNTGFYLNIAINYGGRNEIVRAVQKISNDVLDSKISISEIDEKLISHYLDTKQQDDPDLIIRTAGEKRLSNFLIWQSTYSELFFSKKMWPEFSINDFKIALNDYYQRNRKFGEVTHSKKQLFS